MDIIQSIILSGARAARPGLEKAIDVARSQRPLWQTSGGVDASLTTPADLLRHSLVSSLRILLQWAFSGGAS